MDPVKSQRVAIRSILPGGARDFRPRLADSFESLAHRLGLRELATAGIKVSLPSGRALGVLTTDTDGRRWAIGNHEVRRHDRS